MIMRSETIMRGETNMRRVAQVAMVAMVGGLVPACEQLKPIDGGSAACVPAEVQAAFDRSCGPGCHTGGAAGGGLALDAGQSASAIGASAAGSPLPQIELGNTAGSYLAQKIMDNPTAAITGTRMPQGYSASNTAQVEDINTILTWIGGGVFECASADTGGSSDSGADSGSTDTGSTLRSCALDDLSPGATNPIDSGTGPMQIPPDIATILTENCGCHYTNDYPTPPPYLDYNEELLPLDIATWAGFQATNTGGTPYHAVTLARVMGGPPIAMPPGDPHCAEMNAADTATLVEWLTAEAPDCTTWTGCTGEMIQACGIEDIKPGAANPIDAGSGAGQIPTDIGTILAGNCGCHYVDMPTADVTDYQGTQDISTLAGFQTAYNVAGDPLHELALSYLMMGTMPLAASCDIGGGEAMPPADRALLVQWLTEGTPDGATWMP